MLQFTISIIANIMTHEANDYIFKPFFFFSYYWFSYISFFFSLLRIFELFLPMMWVLRPFFFNFLLLVLLHFILLFVVDLWVVPSYDVGLRDLWQMQEFESFNYELWIIFYSIFNQNNNIYLFYSSFIFIFRNIATLIIFLLKLLKQGGTFLFSFHFSSLTMDSKNESCFWIKTCLCNSNLWWIWVQLVFKIK